MALIRSRSFLRNVSSPRGMVEDFMEVVRQAGDNRWRIGVAAAICTVAVFSVMWNEGGRGKPKPPEITYITVWDPHRTEDEIIASNIANQKRKERLAAEQARREEDVKQMYMALGRATGMDVDAIAKKAKADQAAEAAREKAAVQPQAPTKDSPAK
ncbi:hypothetical protein KRR38_28400 [Novosphingobium sp. G106]|uniref:hypothetical protein n=1 Tax=Novosphingobium sp. G106 TaxID=2849500 RepID=UPI001C2DEB1D|nr:hypothetical protein [Novosphingobium sp. G106]MBV1691498.1 hypothetical protein [Novosphingobium sp. G106]